MKLIRRRKPSLNTLLGITKAKRSFTRATGIPTTKAGIKRKAANILTNGAYGKYERVRAAVNRPYKIVSNPPSFMGWLIWLCIPVVVTLVFVLAVLL